MQLPPELRLIIWKLCLPYRVAQEDAYHLLLDGADSHQACHTKRTTRLNAQPPVIAFVNSESRQIALKEGCMLEPTNSNSGIESFWVQPRRDILHFNWTRWIYTAWGYSDLDSPMFAFLYRAHELGIQPSIVAEVIWSFNLDVLFNGAGSTDSPNIFERRTGPVIYEKGYYNRLGEDDVEQISWFTESCRALQEHHSRLDIAIGAVSLHITKEVALMSGLFGLLGDAPVQMIDIDDTARLREFEALLRKHALEKEPAAQTLFELFTSSRFRAAVEEWKEQAEWMIFTSIWQIERRDIFDQFGVSPESAWIPYLLDPEGDIWMSDYSPNKEHPWLRPWIMVQYCTNECYIKENLPQGFGR
ncbi:hypothetical protein BDV26DRAFT_286839 [Aspergillus bertholletiae]|uniref:2EXR domain-containing protein n=1 Tax=Aspergillus bertholletiae TaxID=1226010 RepID=A0A5N7ANF4_9EURO|nr:hypothetical protein BDV26DRAFT_286839 [Aspergillus bertholletiae]